MEKRWRRLINLKLSGSRMRHRLRGRKLGRVKRVRKSLLANLAISLILEEKITTTQAKAKAVKPFVERLVEIAKKNDLSAKRSLMSKLFNDQLVVKKLMKKIAPEMKDRVGGYVKMVRLLPRAGDNAPQARLELIE